MSPRPPPTPNAGRGTPNTQQQQHHMAAMSRAGSANGQQQQYIGAGGTSLPPGAYAVNASPAVQPGMTAGTPQMQTSQIFPQAIPLQQQEQFLRMAMSNPQHMQQIAQQYPQFQPLLRAHLAQQAAQRAQAAANAAQGAQQQQQQPPTPRQQTQGQQLTPMQQQQMQQAALIQQHQQQQQQQQQPQQITPQQLMAHLNPQQQQFFQQLGPVQQQQFLQHQAMALFNKQQGPRPAVQYQQPQQHLLQQQQAAAAGAGGTRPMQMSTPQQQLQQQHLQQQQQQRLQQQHQQQQAQTLAQQQAQTVAQQQPQSLAQQQQQAQTLAQQQAQTLAQLHQLPAASNGAQQNTANKTTQQQMPRQLPPSSAGMSMTSPAAHTQQHNPNMQAAVGTSAPGAPAAAAVVHNAGAAGGGAPTMNLAQFQQELKVIQSQIAQLVGGLSAADAAQFKELTSMFGERFNLQTKVNALPPGEEQLKSQLEKEVNAKNASIQALRDSAPPNVALAFSKYLRGFGLRRQAELLQHRLSQIAAARQAGQAAGAAHPQAALLQQQALARGLSLAQLQAMQQRQQQQQAAAPAGTAQATLAASLVHAQQQAQLQLQQQQQQAGRGAQTQQTMLQNQQLQQQAASHALLAQQTIAAQTREAMGAAEGGRPAMIQNPGARPQQMTAADMHNLQLRQRAIMEARARAQMQGQAAGAVGGAASGLTAQQIQQMRMRQAAQAAMQQQGNLSAAMGVIPQGVSVQPNTTHAASMAAVSANLMGNPAQVPSALAAQQAAMQARPRGPTASPAGTVRPDFPGNARARPQSVPGAVRPIAQPRPSAVQPMQQSQQQQLAAVKQQQQPANAAAIKLQSQQPHQPALVGPKLEKLPDSGPDPNDGWTPTAKDEGLYNPNNPFTPDFFKNQFTHGIGKIQRFVPRKASPAPGDTAPHGPSTGAAVVADPNVDLDAEPSKPPTAVGSPAVGKMGLGKRKLNELMEQIAPRHRLEPEAEQFFLRLADDFLLDVVGRASKAAKHRGDSSVGVKDLQFELERNWNLRIPGYTAEPRAARRTTVANSHQSRLTLVHKQRLADNARVKAARAAKAAGGAAVVLS